MSMDEKAWVRQIANQLERDWADSNLLIETGKKVPYASEILHYTGAGKINQKLMVYETDLLISEKLPNDLIKPRIIVEAKLKSVTTHDAITYSHKAFTHKQVHPYLRYGIMLGARRHYPLPGRLFRHGANFDFMFSFKDFGPDAEEWKAFVSILKDEIRYSQLLDQIIFHSRSRHRDHYTSLQKALLLK